MALGILTNLYCILGDVVAGTECNGGQRAKRVTHDDHVLAADLLQETANERSAYQVGHLEHAMKVLSRMLT